MTQGIDAMFRVIVAKRIGSIAAIAVLVMAVIAGGWWWSREQTAAPRATVPVLPMLYLAVEPPFVTNLAGGDAARLLQVGVSVATRSPETFELMKANLPALRDALLMRFAGHDFATLATLAGKEKLRTEVHADVRRIVAAAGGRADSVVAVLFVGFVVQ